MDHLILVDTLFDTHERLVMNYLVIFQAQCKDMLLCHLFITGENQTKHHNITCLMTFIDSKFEMNYKLPATPICWDSWHVPIIIEHRKDKGATSG